MDKKLGFGTFPIKEKLLEVIPYAEECGYSFIDTSDDYFNESFVASACSQTKMKIFTKFSFVDNVLHFDDYFSQQLRQYTDYNQRIYCYLLHWPYPFVYKKIWRKMEQLYLDHVVDEIGVCNFTEEHLKELLKHCRVKPMYNEIELHPLFQQKKVTDFCVENGIQIISYSPFARMDPELFANNTIQKIAQDNDTTIQNVILKWNIQKGFIPIPSTSKLDHLGEMSLSNLKNIHLSDAQMAAIDGMDIGKRIRFDPNTYFSKKTKVKLWLYSLLMR